MGGFWKPWIFENRKLWVEFLFFGFFEKGIAFIGSALSRFVLVLSFFDVLFFFLFSCFVFLSLSSLSFSFSFSLSFFWCFVLSFAALFSLVSFYRGGLRSWLHFLKLASIFEVGFTFLKLASIFEVGFAFLKPASLKLASLFWSRNFGVSIRVGFKKLKLTPPFWMRSQLQFLKLASPTSSLKCMRCVKPTSIFEANSNADSKASASKKWTKLKRSWLQKSEANFGNWSQLQKSEANFGNWSQLQKSEANFENWS